MTSPGWLNVRNGLTDSARRRRYDSVRRGAVIAIAASIALWLAIATVVRSVM